MDQESKKFLTDLLAQCGPSGFETDIQDVWLKRTKKYADTVRKDVHGNAIAVLNAKADFRIMLAGHCDEIGFIISHITEEGFLYFTAIGGIDAGVIPGSQVQIKTKKGFVGGVIGKRAIHMMTEAERKTSVPLKDLYIDIGAKDRKNALKYVQLGDSAVIKPNFIELQNGLFSSKGCDNRTGAFVVSEVLKILSKSKSKLKVGVYSVSTVQEEVGLRGAITSAYAIKPHAAIAVDVGHATDTPDIDRRVHGETFLDKGPILGHGPVINPILGKILIDTADKKKIPYQIRATSRPGGTDTAMIQISREGVATALVAVPNRYMHTAAETCSFNDVANAAKLIAEAILTIKPGQDFVPA
ncbi:MAG: M42 family metallopeptidase [Candidatus Omnitrophica bacterium]|nr:M42 family metallopeptidase [Candidatus Omnitrophota bacterium]